MSEEVYNKIIAESKNVALLINEKKVSGLTSFKKTDSMTPEFIAWVSPKYLAAFEEIYRKNINTNEGVICATLRASFLADEATNKKMATIVLPHIDSAIESAQVVLEDIAVTPKNIVNHTANIEKDFSYLNRELFNQLTDSLIQDKRKVFIETYMKVCDILKNFKPRKHPVEYGIYAGIVSKLAELNMEGTYGGNDLLKHEQNASKKQTLYIVGTIVIFILIILKWVLRFNR